LGWWYLSSFVGSHAVTFERASLAAPLERRFFTLATCGGWRGLLIWVRVQPGLPHPPQESPVATGAVREAKGVEHLGNGGVGGL